MDSSDIYYSDNSQLIDENNSEWISNTVMIENQDITWQEDGPEITVDYSEPANVNKTLTESDSFLTAENEGSGVETSEYFSILEPNCEEGEYSGSEDAKCLVKVHVSKEEIILPDITKNSIGEQYKQTEDNPTESTVAENADDQVILYRMEGSDELYAVQLADDGNGNFQKYKYRVRQNENGQLEAVPGSIEIQKADLEQPENNESSPDSDLELEQPQKDQKPSSEALALINQQISEDSEIENSFYDATNFENINPVDFLMQSTYQDDEEEYQTVDGVHVTADDENAEVSAEETDNVYLQEEETNSEAEYEIEELDDAFQDDNEEEEPNNIENTQILQKSNIDNTKLNEAENRSVTIFKDDKHLSYLVVKTKEKENLVIRPTDNLRSLLKSSWVNNKKKEKEKPTLPTIISNTKVHKDPIPINNIQKPRQPRKQTIKPVDRGGSEIIVQPLVYTVSDNNVLFPVPEKRKRVVEEGSYVVSDESDPEFTLKPLKKKIKKIKTGKRGRPKIEITILDTDEETDDESEESVIEVTDQEDNESNQTVTDETPEIIDSKKNIPPPEEKEIPLETLTRKSINKQNKCPHCPKTFPRLITLKKHLMIHNTRRSLRSNNQSPIKTETYINPLKSRPLNCLKCKLKFLTEIQFKRHQTIHLAKRKDKSPLKKLNQNKTFLRSQNKLEVKKAIESKTKEIFKCEYCSQQFGTRTLLIIHRNSHKTFPCPNCKTTFTAKLLLDDHLRKNCVKISPNKSKRFSQKKINSKCDVCNQIFPTARSLIIHKNITHKPVRTVSKPIITKPPVTKIKGAHGGVPPSLKMQQALNKLNKVKS